MTYVYLLIAIVSEVTGTTALKMSDGFTRPWPAIVVAAAYGASFYFLSLVLRSLPVGITYAIWSGLGIVLIAVIGWALFGQKLDLPALAGMALIISGILVMNLFSRSLEP